MKPKVFNTPREMIKGLGGPTKVARRLGVARQSVTNWSADEQLPAKTKDAFKAWLDEVGADAPDSLWPMLRLSSECEQAQ